MKLPELIRRLQAYENGAVGRRDCDVEIEDNKFIIYERKEIDEIDVNEEK